MVVFSNERFIMVVLSSSQIIYVYDVTNYFLPFS